ncbi:hypothetical protein BH10BDE1_BH10BDE1_19770 [soil metagenome]
MGQPELFLEFTREGQKPRHHRVTAKRRMYVIGSSSDADLRIGGEGIMGCHAVLQHDGSTWTLRSLALEGAAVRVNGVEVIEAVLNQATATETVIEIGAHRIDLFSKNRSEALFAVGETKSTGPLTMHQVVVKSSAGRVLKTAIMPAKDSYRYDDGERVTKLAAPSSGEWIETVMGRKVIRQRLVSHQEAAATEKLTVDSDMKRAVGAALLLMLLLMSAALLMPKPSAKPELALDQKSIDMIFNADKIKQKRVEAKKITQTAKQRAGGHADAPNSATQVVSQPEQSMAPTQSAKATAALTSIRNSGLSALIGKIAKRANKNGIMIAAQGTTADNKNAGRAFFSNGTTTTGGGGAAATAGNAYRLGGIATRGKGGGATGVRDGTGLSGGTVGTGDVAMVDEETVIEGGLDRDVIADVIRRNLGQIRYCYERQLSSNPELYGKLLVKFTIDAGGGVLEPKIDTSTMKSSLVEGCVLRRLAGWKFPLPKGGTQVRVSYPFLFKALD